MSDLSRSVERDSVQRAASIMYVDEGSGSTHSPLSTGYNKLRSPQNIHTNRGKLQPEQRRIRTIHVFTTARTQVL